MSMIGKLRQFSEFELAQFKKNPAAMARTLAASPGRGPLAIDPQAQTELRNKIQQTPVVQRMMELAKQGQAPTREEQLELQKQMMALLKEAAGQMRRPQATDAPASPKEQPPSNELDLHKSWHCLHYLFTGKVEGSDGSPLGDAIIGGTEVGGEEADTGYGPPRALSPAQVRNVAKALEDFPIEQKAKEFDAESADRAGVYVAQHGVEELKDYFVQLRKFYTDAANKGNGMLLWIE